MRFVLCSKVIVIALMSLNITASAQSHFRWAYRHNPEYDNRKISYGFSIGLHTSAYQVNYSPKFVTPDLDTIHSVIPPFSPGFSLGFLMNFRINEMLDLRLMPKAGFYEHRLQYRSIYRETSRVLVATTMVEVPLLLKFKSMRRGNVRMYMVGGVTPGLSASGRPETYKEVNGSKFDISLPIRKTNISLDAGIGFDFYFPLFKFSQEIRFSKGVRNLLGDDTSAYREPITSLNTNTISVYFIFQ